MKKIFFAILLFFLSLGAYCQTMRELFVSLPDSVILPQLSKINREDCVDFLDSKMDAVITNRFDGKSQLDTLTSDYLHLTLSSMSTVEMKLFPTSDSTRVICWVQTYGNDSTIKESIVRFFSTDWRELPAADYIVIPCSSDFVKEHGDVDTDVAIALSPLFVAASLSPAECIIRFYATLGHLSKEVREKVSSCIEPDKVLPLSLAAKLQ